MIPKNFLKTDKRHQSTDSRSTTDSRKNTNKKPHQYIIIKLETKFSFCWRQRKTEILKKWSKKIPLPKRNNHKPHSWLLNRNTESPAEREWYLHSLERKKLSTSNLMSTQISFLQTEGEMETLIKRIHLNQF